MVSSYINFLSLAENQDNVGLYLFKPEKENHSMHNALQEIEENIPGFQLYVANANEVKEISNLYDLVKFPVMLLFKNGKHAGTIRGQHNADYYRKIIQNTSKTEVRKGLESAIH